MKLEGWLVTNRQTGRADFTYNGEAFSMPPRFADRRVKVFFPSAAEPLASEGLGSEGVRGTLRLNNGRAEMQVGSGEVISFPPKYAGKLVAIDVVDLMAEVRARAGTMPRTEAQAPAATQTPAAPAQARPDFSRERGDRALLAARFDPEDLDIL